MDIRYKRWLCSLTQSDRDIRFLLEEFGSARQVYEASDGRILKLGDLSIELRLRLIENKNEEALFLLEQNMAKYHIQFVSKEEEHFPCKLRDLSDCPEGLFYQGTLPEPGRPSIAIIGSRTCTHYGEEMAYYFSEILADRGVDIISGLALGIDNFAHVGALKAKGRTYAVLGSGIGAPYPKENWKTFQNIVQSNGGILSEYPYGTPAYKSNFPIRNRLISGLSDGVLVVEAKLKSGTMITVDRALEQGKEVYCIPGRVSDVTSGGCNQLIKQGARMVTEPEEIIEDLVGRYQNSFMGGHNNTVIVPEDNTKKEILLASDEKIVYACLRLDLKHFDALISETKLAPAELAEILLSLEDRGIIKQPAPNYYSVSYNASVEKD